LLEFATAAPAGATLADGGIRPDVLVDPSPDAALRGDDSAMSEALRQIARSRAADDRPINAPRRG
jgi:hypothetical protein